MTIEYKYLSSVYETFPEMTIAWVIKQVSKSKVLKNHSVSAQIELK